MSVRKSALRLPAVHETSAGGLCVKVEGGIAYVAVILRRNRARNLELCLPKGHLEKGETPAQAAVREVEEETGARGRVIYQLGTVDYWFSGSSKRIHKVVYHFLMEYLGGELTVENDPDEEAEDAKWIPLLEATTLLSYPNERRVAALAIELLFPPATSS
nr:NUDIX hydrolase [Actinomyces minihominis]